MGTALRGKIANEAPVFRNARPDDFWRAEVRLRLGRAPPSFLMTLTSISGELTNHGIYGVQQNAQTVVRVAILVSS